MQPTSELSDGLNSAPVEAYIIGSVLNDYALLDELMTQIPPQMFSNSHHQELWQVMCDLRIRGEPVDMATLTINAPALVQRITLNRLMSMQKTSLGRVGLDRHVAKLHEMFIRRELSQGARLLAQRALDVAGTSVDELMAGYEQFALTIMQTTATGGLHDGEASADQWLKRIRKKMDDPMSAWGFITGWPELDELTLGWQRQDLIVVGGRTSIGKSAFAAENVLRMLRAERKVAVFSLEMSEDDLKDRMASNMTGIPFGKIRVGEISEADYKRLEQAKKLIGKMAITDERGLSTENIIAQMKRWKRQRGLDFVVVDYLQEIKEKAEPMDNAGSALSRIARKIRKAAKDCDCAVMALSQLTRDSEGKKPSLASLSGSSGIENTADVTILLHRDRNEEPDLLYVNLAKQRNGRTGEVQMNYNGMFQRIRSDHDMTKDD